MRYNATANVHHCDDDFCESCGYPFDRHERCIDLTNGYGPLVCSERCANEAISREESRRFQWLHNPAN